MLHTCSIVLQPHVDWKCYDTALGGLLSGQQYQHRLSSVEGATEWNRLLEAVSQWYGKVFCVKRKTADKGRSWIYCVHHILTFIRKS